MLVTGINYDTQGANILNIRTAHNSDDLKITLPATRNIIVLEVISIIVLATSRDYDLIEIE
jgi:hypothetical protein